MRRSQQQGFERGLMFSRFVKMYFFQGLALCFRDVCCCSHIADVYLIPMARSTRRCKYDLIHPAAGVMLVDSVDGRTKRTGVVLCHLVNSADALVDIVVNIIDTFFHCFHSVHSLLVLFLSFLRSLSLCLSFTQATYRHAASSSQPFYLESS